MSVSASASKRETSAGSLTSAGLRSPRRSSRIVTAARGPQNARHTRYSFVDLGDSARLAMTTAPNSRGTFAEQAQEVLAAMRAVLEQQPVPMVITVQTVFLQNRADQAEFERLLTAQFGSEKPVTNYVYQPPCCQAALAVEAWAIGGPAARVERYDAQTMAVSYDGVRWLHCGGIEPDSSARGGYGQTLQVLERIQGALSRAGSGFGQIVRTWFYLGGITDPDADARAQRYQELNRARTDFYRDIQFCRTLIDPAVPHAVYPASTGIGMTGAGLVASCLALETTRKDLRLLPLENPHQTPAYAYERRHSAQSPKFSRAMALVTEDYATTWVSGTASIVDSESLHPGDVARQTGQTIDNIERLITAENFAASGVKGVGVRLRDMAKIRVYLKRLDDLAQCQAICQRRFPSVPVIYAVADVCRPELLVEIEGVAFSRRQKPA